MDTAYLRTPLGIAVLRGDVQGLREVSILDEDHLPAGDTPESLEDACYQLQEYFEGHRKVFDLKLNPVGSQFQEKVWQLLLEIPYGETISYLELSKRLGDVKAIRAVAAANGKNPLWIIVPCHRVVGSDGSLTGYAGGLARKQWLLEHESPYKQGRLF